MEFLLDISKVAESGIQSVVSKIVHIRDDNMVFMNQEFRAWCLKLYTLEMTIWFLCVFFSNLQICFFCAMRIMRINRNSYAHMKKSAWPANSRTHTLLS